MRPDEVGVGRRRWRSPVALFVGGAVALVLILLLVTLVVAVAVDRDDRAQGVGDRSVSVPRDALDPDADADADAEAATLELLDGADAVTIRTADPGGALLRAGTPDGSHLYPRAVVDRRVVRVSLVEHGPPGASAVEVLLDPEVRWTVRVLGGAVTEVVDVAAGRLAGVDIVGGVTRVEVSLPAPEGAVGVRMAGGAGELLVRAPTAVPVRVRAGAGAGTVTIDGVARNGVAAGTVFEPPGWAAAGDRVDVAADAGAGTVTVLRR